MERRGAVIRAEDSTDPEELDRLSNDHDIAVKWRVAQNRNTRTDTLDELANSEEPSVRWRVTNNPNAGAETLDKLSNDENRLIRSNVVFNPNTLLSTLLKLVNDKEDDIARDAKEELKNRDVLGDLLGESRCYESFQEWRKLSNL